MQQSASEIFIPQSFLNNHHDVAAAAVVFFEGVKDAGLGVGVGTDVGVDVGAPMAV